MRKMLFIGCALLASGCVVREVRQPPPPVVYREPPPPPPPAYQYQPPPQPQPQYGQPVPQDQGWESVQVEPPMEQPAPVAIPYAPPPMVWDPPPPRPWVEGIWVGGHWTWWNGQWVWARGYWARAPNAGWVYTEPYYEYRGDNVVFVAGFWRPGYRVFVPPPATVYIPVVQVTVVHVGYVRPMGPHGVFVPAPPGSQPGVIVPCPVGTPPAVVLSAPPVVRPGMMIRPVPRGGVVEVYAPAGVTREGRPVTAQAPMVSHEAAAVHPVVVTAPPPIRNDGTFQTRVNRPTGLPGPQYGNANVGGTPVATPVPNNGNVQVRQIQPAPGQPPVQPALRPEAMGGDRPGPRPWSNGQGNTEGEGPILRPVQRGSDMPPRPQPAQADPPVVRQPPAPVSPAPAATVSAASRPLPPGQAKKLEPAPGRAHPPAKKADPGEHRGHPDAREQ